VGASPALVPVAGAWMKAGLNNSALNRNLDSFDTASASQISGIFGVRKGILHPSPAPDAAPSKGDVSRSLS